ncbi:MAG: zinc-dependent peptidase [Proteobacteria bacterium]|uniref:zinc-dependent peptidase n=1 Tax=Aquabacterium sp. TaxID=1872578 RepID=UPI0035C71B43|nr:zinc-dependent peptidase [Pseudomonadota bacterium]
MPIAIVAIFSLLLVAWFIGQPLWVARQRDRTQADPFPLTWRRILRRRVPLVALLPADLQLQLKKHIQVFLAEKAFIGCKGQPITDEVRVTIAAQACLLLLNRPGDYFPALRQILVYPSAFLVEHEQVDDAGVVQARRDLRSGESWQQGQVILAWDDVLRGAADPHDGWNVVIHEFAHQLDSQTGLTNGAPDLGSAERYAQWSEAMQSAYDALCADTDAWETGGPEPFLDPYGASDPAEFFAVVTETFFERPRALSTAHPELYRELSRFYRVHPAGW